MGSAAKIGVGIDSRQEYKGFSTFPHMNERFIKTVEILLNSLFMFLNSLSHILFHYVNIVVCLIILKCFQLFMNFLTLPAALLRNNCN